MRAVKTAILSTIFSCICLFAFAQNNAVKVAHINTNDLLQVMPEYKAADVKMQQYGADLDAELSLMTKEYQKKVADFQAKQQSGQMAESVRQTKIKEIQDMEARIQQFQNTAQDDIVAKQNELLNPIIEKAKNAINAVATENGYTYVLDTSTGTVLFSVETHDIMSKVKTKLGL